MKPSVFIIVLLVASSGCRSAGPAPIVPAISVCDLIAAAAVYDGTNVTVRGKYRASPEYSVLFGDECHPLINLHMADDYKASRAVRRSFHRLLGRNHFAAVEIVARGTFRAAGPQECFGHGCLQYDLLLHEVLSARTPPKPDK